MNHDETFIKIQEIRKEIKLVFENFHSLDLPFSLSMECTKKLREANSLLKDVVVEVFKYNPETLSETLK